MDVYQNKCAQCDKIFSNISNLRKHVKKFHPEQNDYLISLQLRKNRNYKFSCEKCNKNFMHLKHLRYHAKIHGCLNENILNTSITINTKRNQCAMCNNFCADRKSVIEHYRQFHNISIDYKKLVFETEKEFINWKLTFENNTNCKYVIESHKTCKSHISKDFVCHRSGRYVPEGKNIRKLKITGSKKINALCPASIKMKRLNNGTCEVTIIDQHVGHHNDKVHLDLSKKGRRRLAMNIVAKIPFEDILDEIRNTIPNSQPKPCSEENRINAEEALHTLEPTAHLKELSKPTTSFAAKKRNVLNLLEELKSSIDCMTSKAELDVAEKVIIPLNHMLAALQDGTKTKTSRSKLCNNNIAKQTFESTTKKTETKFSKSY